MPIGPVTNSLREISVTEPLAPALERVKTMLFKPFDLGKWFTIGFCAWLAFLGERGGFNFNYNSGGSSAQHTGESFRHFYDRAREYTVNNLDWILPAAAAAALLLLILWVAILWLSSRGKFMFLHCVAVNRAEVSLPWSRFEREANSLFWFRLIFGLCSMLLMLPLLAVIGLLIVQMILRGEPDVGGIMLAAGFAMLFFFLAIVFAVIHKFMNDFVVPLQFLRGGGCLAAWREFLKLLAGHPGLFTLYLLFQIVLGMAIGIVIVLAMVLTCCVAFCVLIIPYLGTVLLLPVLVFKQSYPLYFLRQFGPGYDVFPPEASTPPAAGLQPLGAA